MASTKLGFENFISTVEQGTVAVVNQLHGYFTQAGCRLEVKEAKSGYVVSYLLKKKTVANYVFRKKGLLIRLYADHVGQYLECLEELPVGLAKTLKAAPDCKRLLDPAACNPKCNMGYDFLLEGERLQKCRYNAFLLLLCEENNPFIQTMVQRELAALEDGCPTP